MLNYKPIKQLTCIKFVVILKSKFVGFGEESQGDETKLLISNMLTPNFKKNRGIPSKAIF